MRYSLDQRALAAAWAISRRCSGLNRSARTTPPILPPLRPKATACGFLRRLRGFRVSESPVAVSTIRRAVLVGSDSLLERFGMTRTGLHK